MGKALILIAEDDEETRSLYYWALVEAGFDVAAASDGEEALELLASLHPDLILTDILMPKIDGLGLIERVRENLQIADTPIVAMSAQRGDVQDRALKAGATRFVDKLQGLFHLVETVDELLSVRQLVTRTVAACLASALVVGGVLSVPFAW